mgnify:CR=1 FL=1
MVLCNAITGEMQDYRIDEVPEWIDRAYSADLLVQLYDYYGSLKHGFINSVLGQKDCLTTTNGYNYLAMNDDVRNIMFSMAKRAKEKGILVVFDCNYREKLWKKKYEDAIPNYKKIIEIYCFVREYNFWLINHKTYILFTKFKFKAGTFF